MTEHITRKGFAKGAAAGAAAVGFGVPAFVPRIGEAAEALKIGVLEPATGVYAAPGGNEVNGMEMVVEAWNAKGGVMGRKIELVKEDEQSDPGVGVQKARKLVNQDKVVALIGTVSSAVSLSVSGAANSLGVLFMDTGGHTDDVTGKDCHWNTFRVCHSTWMEAHAVGATLLRRFGKRWYFITPDYAYGHALETACKDVLAKVGGEIVGNELTPLGTTDFSSYLTKIEPKKPDCVIVLVQGDDQVNCLKQMNQFGLLKKFPAAGPQVELEPQWQLPPEARGGYWGVEWYYKSDLALGKGNKAAHDFVTASQKKFGRPPTARNCFGYVGLDRVLVAMAEAKSTDASKVAKAIEGVKFTSIFAGSGYFRKEDHQLMWPMWVADIRPNGTPSDKLDIFNVIDTHEADAIEQSVAEKAKVCKLNYPA